MTQPVIPTLPTAPSRGSSPSTFTADADAWVAALPAFGSSLNDMGTYVTAQATSATTSAANAASSEAVATAGANFAGNWSSLVGALNTPASVYHNNRYWLLLNNLADVTTSQPGVSADWQEYRTTNAFSIISTSANFI